MSIWLRFVLGLVARALGVLLGRYAEWRFHHLGDEDDDFGFATDLHDFALWLIHGFSGRLSYQPASGQVVEYDDWRSEWIDR